MNQNEKWFAKSIEEIEKKLESNLEKGLSSEQVEPTHYRVNLRLPTGTRGSCAPCYGCRNGCPCALLFGFRRGFPATHAPAGDRTAHRLTPDAKQKKDSPMAAFFCRFPDPGITGRNAS